MAPRRRHKIHAQQASRDASRIRNGTRRRSTANVSCGESPRSIRRHSRNALSRTSNHLSCRCIRARRGRRNHSERRLRGCFRALRHTDEPSFAGGVFIVARTEDKFTWDILRTKGHVLSRNGKYAAFYLPYHFMGVETPAGIDSMSNGADRYESPSKATVIMAGKATTAIPAGTSLKVSGHHHDIAGIRPILINASEAERNTVPFYMLDNTTVIHNTEPGSPFIRFN